MAAIETKTRGRTAGGIFGRIGVLLLVAASFATGLLGAIYLSLRSPEVAVPEIVGKNQSAGREQLEDAGLSMRVRTSRFAPNAPANSILDQSPRPGEIVKVGQTVAVVIARSEAREGEVAAVAPTPTPEEQQPDDASTAAPNAKDNRNADNAERNQRTERGRPRNQNRNPNQNRSPTDANRNANRNANPARNLNVTNAAPGVSANRAANVNRPAVNANRSLNINRPAANVDRNSNRRP